MATTFKVATLVIKTLVKPVANQLKKNAVNEGWFRDSCHWAGQVSNTVLTHIQLRSLGHKVKKIKPMPTDDAVKAGADLFAEGMVLFTGMIFILAEVCRKSFADAAAAEKKRITDIETKTKKELRQLEKEKLLREHLLSLEARMIDVENAKFSHLHEKLVYEQQKHLFVTENLLKRIHYLEQQLKINNIYPLMPEDIEKIPKPQYVSKSKPKPKPPTTPPPSHQLSDNTKQAAQDLQLSQETTSTIPNQEPAQVPKLSEQTSQLFNYGAFHRLSDISSAIFGSSTPTPPSQPKQQPPKPQDDRLVKEHLAEEDFLHHLLDTSLPVICASQGSSQICVIAPAAAAMVLEDSDPLPLEKMNTILLAPAPQQPHDQSQTATKPSPTQPPPTSQKQPTAHPTPQPSPKPPQEPALADPLPPPKVVPGKEHLMAPVFETQTTAVTH